MCPKLQHIISTESGNLQISIPKGQSIHTIDKWATDLKCAPKIVILETEDSVATGSVKTTV